MTCKLSNSLMLAVFALMALLLPMAASAQTVAWQAKENEAVIAFGRPDVGVVVLAVHYDRSCNSPVAKAVIMTGKDLGPELNRTQSKGIFGFFGDMIWEVDGRAFGGKTFKIEHTHGTQYVMLASSGLLAALESGRTIKLALPKSRPVNIPYQLTGFSQAVATAKSYFC